MLLMKRSVIILLVLISFALPARKAKESLPHIYYVSFPVVTAAGQLTLSGQYRLPGLVSDTQIPAVVILHSSGGVDSTGSFYTRALNKMGIATLELDMWSPRGYTGGTSDRPETVQETIPDTYAALAYLAARPEIDPEKIGVLGFSWGGVVAMLSATAQYYDLMGDGVNKFAGYVAHYPSCWVYNHPAIAGFEFIETLGQPILIQVGGNDDYEADPDSCTNFVSSLSQQTQDLIRLRIYPHAHHAWDRQEPALQVYDPIANRGLGGLVDLIPDQRISKQSKKQVRQFFNQVFAVGG